MGIPANARAVYDDFCGLDLSEPVSCGGDHYAVHFTRLHALNKPLPSGVKWPRAAVVLDEGRVADRGTLVELFDRYPEMRDIVRPN